MMNYFIGVVCLILVGAFGVTSAINYTRDVSTEKGIVRGEILYTVWNAQPFGSFKGIPFAVPPIGNDRFKPPQANPSWNGTRDTIKEGSVCTQYDQRTQSVIGSEDCLYLNVYTPLSALSGDKKLPVMMWIYGGSFIEGYSNYSLFGPDFILEDDVILVTSNYRLGAFGFISLQMAEASGNAALKDQYMVLKWVKANIANFGGDPNRVTLFGESAGGVCTALHALSPKSNDLFQQYAVQSASVLFPFVFHTPEAAQQQAFNLGTLLGHNTTDKNDLLKFLLSVPADQIISATRSMSSITPPFLPVVENPLLPAEAEPYLTKCPWTLYNQGEYKSRPIIMGYNANEALSLAFAVQETLRALRSSIDVIINNVISPIVHGVGGESLFNLFFYIFNLIWNTAADTIVNAILNLPYTFEIDYTQKILAKWNKEKIFYYRLSYNSIYALHRVSGHQEINGTAHADDTGFLFHTPLFNVPTDKYLDFNIFRKSMVRLWTNFAKFQNPTPNKPSDALLNVTWVDSRPTGEQLDINEVLTMHERFLSQGGQFVEDLIASGAPTYTGCR